MHCQVNWQQPYWNQTASRKHQDRKGNSKRLWERSILASYTEGNNPSLYDPNLTEIQIAEIEMACIAVPANELNQRMCRQRLFWTRFDNVIGASEGKKTEYILVKYDDNGAVHGFPVTKACLQNKGAQI